MTCNEKCESCFGYGILYSSCLLSIGSQAVPTRYDVATQDIPLLLSLELELCGTCLKPLILVNAQVGASV